ncbi:MAG: RelA/SpoT domain-containing protein [Nanoarchaeota archaeon]
MEWVKPGNYSKNNVDRIGEILRGNKKLEYSQEQLEAFNTFNNWRASHAYPLHIIMKNIKKISLSICPEAICVQRLKRVKSIIIKLNRFPEMKLSRIEDIGGCRIVMPNVDLARKLMEQYISKNKRHKRIKSREKNYINYPKPDGYRSIHLVYSYYSINKVGEVFNGKIIEIQIRSKLQHVWATALETVDLFSHQRIKFGSGDPNWKYFFRLVSSAFALMEKCPAVYGTPSDKKELYEEIKKIEKELNVRERMVAWRSTVQNLSNKKDSLFVLKLDMKNKQISYNAFKNDRDGWAKANEDFSLEERNNQGNKDCDVILVGADSIKELTDGYRNYFADTEEFLKNLKLIIDYQHQ